MELMSQKHHKVALLILHCERDAFKEQNVNHIYWFSWGFLEEFCVGEVIRKNEIHRMDLDKKMRMINFNSVLGAASYQLQKKMNLSHLKYTTTFGAELYFFI